jgi:hypothetical protein
MTGDSGVTLGLDLFELYRAGRQSLPPVSGEFFTAGASVAAAGAKADPLFSRHEIFGGAKGPAYAEWTELKNTIERFLKETSDNVEDVASALVLAANTYASTDHVASQELDRLKRENHVE